MANFQFNDEQNAVRTGKQTKKVGGLKGMLINMKLAKDEKQADMYLVVILVIVVGLIIYINFI